MEQDAYQTAVTKLLAYLDQTVTFAQGQLPEIATQILSYGAYDAVLGMWTFGIIAAILLLISAWMYISSWGNDWSDSGIGSLILLVIGIVLTVCAVQNFSVYKKIELAPKVYVVEQVRGMLIKGDK